MQERRRKPRREKRVRNIFAYRNRRDLFKKGRRKDEDKYQLEPDWFEQERRKGR